LLWPVLSIIVGINHLFYFAYSGQIKRLKKEKERSAIRAKIEKQIEEELK